MRRLQRKWETGPGWPKRLDWIEISGLRGWSGQRFNLQFPIMAVVGENGAGKSTILQCAMSVYSTGEKRERYASDHFLDTPWERIQGASIRYSLREGGRVTTGAVRRPGPRWRGNVGRRVRNVEWFDLSRVQPISARAGYARITSPGNTEEAARSVEFSPDKLARLARIMSRPYTIARMAMTANDKKRRVPVLRQANTEYSGFHQGAGETTITELLQEDIPDYSLVLIDEIESSLHPRAQRRLIRDLATICREKQLQIVLTTHSPYVLEELPYAARAYIMQTSESGDREIVYGVSPEFAMTRMDDVQHSECELYVEDDRAETLLIEIITAADPAIVERCSTVPFGSAEVGKMLGQMVLEQRFSRPSVVFLDGDTGGAPGCLVLPGDDAPERVIFGGLQRLDPAWGEIDKRISRDFAAVADACTKAMQLGNHHEWVQYAATQLRVSGDILWHAMCGEWAKLVMDPSEGKNIAEAIHDNLDGIGETHPVPTHPQPVSTPPPRPTPGAATTTPLEPAASTSGPETLFSQSQTAPQD